MPTESALRIMFREMIRENFDLVEEELQKRGIGPAASSKKALSVPEVAAATGLSQPTIRRRILSKQIPTIPGLNPARIPADFVDRMMSKA